MDGFGSKKIALANRSRVSPSAFNSSNERSLRICQKSLPLSNVCILETNPPMLCPINTIWSNACQR
jgi:hypothetical protein